MASNVLFLLIGFFTALLTMDWLAEFRTQMTIACVVVLCVALLSSWISSRKRRLQHLFEVMSEYADRQVA